MKKVTDKSGNHPTRFILKDGTTVGMFYNSYDKLNHLAVYVPYKVLPREYLCKAMKSDLTWVSSADENPQKKCKTCFAKLMAMCKKR